MSVLLALLCLAQARAQNPQRTFHLYVDPIHGDDARAAGKDPGASGNLGQNPHPSASGVGVSRPLQNHPAGTGTIPGVLQHAPYAFRTVRAAIAWFQGFPSGPSNQPLPWTNNQTNPPQDLAFAVVHCLPGLYGPRHWTTPANAEDFDPASGLPWNGEQFPIDVPPRVSIQGSSALDTIFDARGYVSVSQGWGQNIFRFQASSAGSEASQYRFSFVDSVALRGCRTHAAPLSGAAIVIGRDPALGTVWPVSPRITNCFIYGNYVGIGIAMGAQHEGLEHQPQIVNNTIAWNEIGIFSGSNAGTGAAEPIVHNNVIDRMIPATATLPAYFGGLGTAGLTSCFEGLVGADLVATLASGACGSGTNFNAYDPAGANTGVMTWGSLGALPRVSTGVTAPVVSLLPITGTWASGTRTTRGALFVRDVLRAAGKTAAPHDFRLAPTVGFAAGGFAQNPLVNSGLSLANGSLLFLNQKLPFPTNALFGLPQVIASPPGIQNDGLATFHAFDWDCEGFGNPREARRTLGPVAIFPEPFGVAPCASRIDLGADEVGELIITGYLDSTRIFSRPHAAIAPNTANLATHDHFFFLNAAVAGVSYIAPQFNLRHDAAPFVPPNTVGTRPEWYAQLGPHHNPFLVASADPSPPFAFTSGQYLASLGTWVTRAALVWDPLTAYPRFMRSRVADLGVHLLDDINATLLMPNRDVDYAEYDFQHPTVPLAGRDIFQVNPWFDKGDAWALPDINDNRWLYVQDLPTSSLRHGTINPPLTIFADQDQGTFPSSFLFRNSTHPIGFWGAPSFLYTVGANGLSAGNSTLNLYGLDWYGYRHNFEVFSPDDPLWVQVFGLRPVNNLQTALVIQSEFADPELPLPVSGMSAGEQEERRLRVQEQMRLEGRRARR